jgi:hypothetical protein
VRVRVAALVRLTLLSGRRGTGGEARRGRVMILWWSSQII